MGQANGSGASGGGAEIDAERTGTVEIAEGGNTVAETREKDVEFGAGDELLAGFKFGGCDEAQSDGGDGRRGGQVNRRGDDLPGGVEGFPVEESRDAIPGEVELLDPIEGGTAAAGSDALAGELGEGKDEVGQDGSAGIE